MPKRGYGKAAFTNRWGYNIVSSGEVCREECLSNNKNLSLLGENYYFIGQELDKGIAKNLEIKEENPTSLEYLHTVTTQYPI